jgi:hypothetical protein
VSPRWRADPRGGRPRRVQRPGHGRRGSARTAGAARGAPVPQRAGAAAGDGLHWDVLGCTRASSTGCGPPPAGPAARRRRHRQLGGRLRPARRRRRAARQPGALPRRPARDGGAGECAASAPESCTRVTGLQHLPFNTVYQLARARDTPSWRAARRLLLIPTCSRYWLTGAVGAEVTNASTTGLLDAGTGEWAAELIDRLGLPAAVPAAAPSRASGSASCARRPGRDRAGRAGAGDAVGSHDTASAVVGVPAATDRFAYISCGTWSLVGVELDAPVLTEESRRPTSPTSSASTARSATCATSWACGCCRSRCAPGRRGLPAT